MPAAGAGNKGTLVRAPTDGDFFEEPVYTFRDDGIECDTVSDPTGGDPEATAGDKSGTLASKRKEFFSNVFIF